MVSFNFEPGDLGKEIKRETQQFFDSFCRRYAGKPLPTVKSALAREWKSKMNGTMSNAELTDYATLISEGSKIKIT